jgi:hypothetical protein
MGFKIIALDIDGTLVDDWNQIDSMTLRTLQQARARGIKIVLTTGRPLSGTLSLLEKLGLNNNPNEYVITYQGAILETTNGDIIYQNPLTFRAFVNIEMNLFHKPINLLSLTNNSIYIVQKDANYFTAKEAVKNHLSIKFRTLHEMIEKRDELVFPKLMIAGRKENLDNIQPILMDQFSGNYNLIRSENNYIDINQKNVDKGVALQKLVKHLHLVRENVLAIGNGDNDLSMIKYAGLGIGMQNSTSNILKQADIITSSNNDSGVAKAIRKFVLAD